MEDVKAEYKWGVHLKRSVPSEGKRGKEPKVAKEIGDSLSFDALTSSIQLILPSDKESKPFGVDRRFAQLRKLEEVSSKVHSLGYVSCWS